MSVVNTTTHPKTRQDVIVHRAKVLNEKIEELGLTSSVVADLIGCVPGAVNHWRKADCGIQHGSETALAYLLGLNRGDFYPDGEPFIPFLSGVGYRSSLETFAEAYERIHSPNVRPREYDFTETTGREPETLADFDWMVSNGLDVNAIQRFLPERKIIVPAKIDLPSEPEPEQEPEPRSPQVPHVPTDNIDRNRVALLLKNMEQFRRDTGIEWFIRDDGSLGAKRVTVEEF